MSNPAACDHGGENRPWLAAETHCLRCTRCGAVLVRPPVPTAAQLEEYRRNNPGDDFYVDARGLLCRRPSE